MVIYLLESLDPEPQEEILVTVPPDAPFHQPLKLTVELVFTHILILRFEAFTLTVS